MLRYIHPGWMRRTAILPPAFRPFQVRQLVRVGGTKDGGYVIDAQSLVEAQFLISGGIDIDWSFEEDFLRRRPVPLVAFDATVGREAYLARAAKAPRLFGPKVDYAVVSRDFQRFFNGSNQHVAKFIGDKRKPGHTDLAEIAREHLPPTGMGFIKLDIEGSEYEVLDQIIDLAPRLTGLAMELHAVPRHMPALLDFIARFPLRVCHVHVNNWEPLTSGRVPRVIEVSFSRYCSGGFAEQQLPMALDRPCCAVAPDFNLRFA